MRRITYFLLLLSYLNILTLIPGTCAAFSPTLEKANVTCIGENLYDDYESIWEILLADVLEQKEVPYQTEDFPISAHYFNQAADAGKIQLYVLTPVPDFDYHTEVAASSIQENTYSIYNSRNAHAQYHDYLFRLTPF